MTDLPRPLKRMSRPIKTLLFSTFFPSSVRPVHGIFVETRLRELLKTGEVETRVVAPVALFPFSPKRFRLGHQNKLVLGITCLVRDWHGVDRIIDRMATADALTNPHLLAVEDRPVRKALEAQARSLGIGDRVTFVGVVHRAAVPTYVAVVFGIALQPAVTSYASPLKLMEYLVLGKAIVALHTENLLEILTDGQNAAMFDDSASGDLAEQHTELRRAHDRRHRLSVAL